VLVSRHHVNLLESFKINLGYAVLTLVFSDDREKYLGMAEAASGMGLMIGPVFGGILYKAAGYFWCFFCFSCVILISSIIAATLVP
jgi:MFS family permease